MTSTAKWRVIAALIILYVAIILNTPWLWVPLFVIWVVPDLFKGVTYFMEPVERNENPMLYWMIMITWIGMTGYSLVLSF